MWGDDLREVGIVVEPMHGIDDLAAAVRRVRPVAARGASASSSTTSSPGSKESRLAASVDDPTRARHRAPVRRRLGRHPPAVLGLDAWPDVPRGVPWKEGMCRALGADPARFWPQLRNRVRTYADLRPELVGAVERLIDFVTVRPRPMIRAPRPAGR